jgi:hypothetical protein
LPLQFWPVTQRQSLVALQGVSVSFGQFFLASLVLLSETAANNTKVEKMTWYSFIVWAVVDK